ncbi:MAG: hypothetical protein OHK0023_00120 [Anaerolineae bacterium]
MSDHNLSRWDDETDYSHYIEKFETQEERKARRGRKPKVKHVPKKSEAEVLAELVDDTAGLEGGFKTTYTPQRFEQGWLLEALRTFYEQSLITDVLGSVKGGKEASVYRCAAHPAVGVALLAAKVYRPRMFRNLRNDALYREGREVLTETGKGLRARDHRTIRALGKKTDYGQQVAHTSWLMHEFNTLKALHEAGAAVPMPYAAGQNAILMGYVGAERVAAPTLHEVRLERKEVQPLFEEVMRNIELLLNLGYAHGDLSAYNILYWEGEITLIDFPQVALVRGNRSAFQILARDIRRVCDYFATYGLKRDPMLLADNMWRRNTELKPGSLPYDPLEDEEDRASDDAEDDGEE